MKLLRKTQGLYLQFVLPVFLLAGIGMYLLLTYAVYDFSDENLHQVKAEIERYVNQHDSLPNFFQTSGNFVDHWPATGGLQAEHLSDTLLFNAGESELEPYRRLEFSLKLNGQNHRLSINQSRLEVEELAVWIGLFLALLFLVLFGLLLWVNRRVSRQVWQPFFNTLRQLRKFKLSENTALQLDDTPVEEFQELHHTLQALTNKLRADFQTVRQFTENASHELQTPLAVIQTKLDLLFQQAQLTEVQAQQLEFINQQTRRMSRLNQALLLLAKIENDQFAVRQEIALKPLLERKLEGLDDLIVAKNLVVETALNPVHIALNPELAETLFANLLGNAVKHNLDGGTLQLALTETELRIRNTCQTPAKPATELSGRFSRGNPQASGLGLGLAIAQEICDKSGLQLTLNVADGVWETLVSWTATS